METEIEVKTFRVEKRCEDIECNGVMRPTGISFPVSPPILEHKCTECGRRSAHKYSYPRIEYRDVN